MYKFITFVAASLLFVTGLSFDSSAQAQDLQALLDRIEALEELTASMRADGRNVYFEGVNVHVRDGSGSTASECQVSQICYPPNGWQRAYCEDACVTAGNLIIGYDEQNSDGTAHKQGFHNLVVGAGHTYTSYAGLVAGMENTLTGHHATVTGGRNNLAKGSYSSVSGGYTNRAEQSYSSVSGGRDNIASGSHSSVSGGRQNVASDYASSVSGGRLNKATQNYSSVSGGNSNTASGYEGSVSGGRYNEAKGDFSSVSGGKSNLAQASYTSVSGGHEEAAIYDYSWATDHIVSHWMVNEVSTGVVIDKPLQAVEFIVSH